MRPQTLEDYLSCAGAGDHRAGVSLAMRLIDDGASAADVISRLLAPAQREVGRRWQGGDWSVADEHVATNVTDAVLAAVSTVRARPRAAAGRIALVCAEQEWHLLPARMAAEQLRMEGWEVTFLGGSIPADHLSAFLAANRPDLVGVSTSLPLHLPGAARSITVAHEAGLPALAGGRGFGPDGRWAAAVGADGWAPDGVTAALVAADLVGAPAGEWPSSLRNEAAAAIESHRDDWVVEAMVDLQRRMPVMDHFTDAQLTRTREDLAYIIDHLAVAALVDDEVLFELFVAWLLDVLLARQVPASALVAGVEVVAELVDDVSPRWASVARRTVADSVSRSEARSGLRSR